MQPKLYMEGGGGGMQNTYGTPISERIGETFKESFLISLRPNQNYIFNLRFTINTN